MDGSIVVSTLVKILGEKLGSAALKELGLLWGVKNDLDALESTISTVRDVLEDAEKCCWNNKQVYNWLRELKDVVYDADDLLDEIYLKAEKRRTESYGQTSTVINNFVANVNPIKRLKLGHKIKSLNKRFDTVASIKGKFHLQSVPTEEVYFQNRDTTSKVNKDSILGRGRELQLITNQLKQINGNECVSIISIVGLGGVGKTTLAQLAYNESYFDQKIWVYVSQDFNVPKIVRNIIQSLSKSECKLKNLDVLVEELTRHLKEKRFLLVLDDIWNMDLLQWEKLKVALECGACGSKIIATTRSKSFSQIMKSTCTFELEGLSEEESWILFKQYAFQGSERQLNSQILKIAKEVVKKCGGVPLALKILGNTMINKSVEGWLAARDSDIWKIDSRDGVMASLRLSYINLPSHLKECFTYCSVFPKGYAILKEDLVDQWMAQGLVPSIEMHKGNDYFEQLVQISFLQKSVEEIDEAVRCNMHDLVHDLAESIVPRGFLIKTDTNVATNENAGCRYMSLINLKGR